MSAPIANVSKEKTSFAQAAKAFCERHPNLLPRLTIDLSFLAIGVCGGPDWLQASGFFVASSESRFLFSDEGPLLKKHPLSRKVLGSILWAGFMATAIAFAPDLPSQAERPFQQQANSIAAQRIQAGEDMAEEKVDFTRKAFWGWEPVSGTKSVKMAVRERVGDCFAVDQTIDGETETVKYCLPRPKGYEYARTLAPKNE